MQACLQLVRDERFRPEPERREADLSARSGRAPQGHRRRGGKKKDGVIMQKLVNIYTDGACSGNQNEKNIGGWGCVLEFAGKEKELSGGEINTTNNRMELTALLKALEALKEDGLELNIFSDSSYLINCFKNNWYINWQNNGWKTSGKTPVENKDLWEKLIVYLAKHKCSFYLVKGHISNPTSSNYDSFCKKNTNRFSFERFKEIVEYNNRCDALANVFINKNRGEE